MILKDHKIIFIHIPKTAGQSVTNYLLKNCSKSFTLNDPDMGLIANIDLKLNGPQNHHHMFLQEYVDLGYINQEDMQSYFKFCVIREPFERFISSFYYNRLHKKYSYETFIDNVLPTLETSDDIYRHFCPQTDYINSDYGSINKIFIMNNTFNEKFTNYFEKNYNFVGQLDKNINKTKVRQDKVKPLDNIIKAKLNKIYKSDIKLYRSLTKHKLDHLAT